MEVTLTAEPTVTATTPMADTAVITQEVTTPDATMATEAAPPAPEASPEYFLKAETGTVYKDRTAAEQGIAEKDRYIELLRQQNQLLASQMQAPQHSAPAQVDPVAEVQARLEAQYRNDPAYEGVDPTSLKLLARANAVGVIEAQREAARTTQQYTAKMQHEAFVASHPELTDSLGQEIYQRQIQLTGRTFDSPEQHLQAVHAELYRRSKAQPHNGNAAAAAQGAMNAQAQQQRVFATPGVSTPPAAPATSPAIQQALEYARQRGVTDPAQLAQIQQIAAQTSPANFGIRRGQ
jgi:hypothetical protein